MDSSLAEIVINLDQALYVLSDALDFVGIDDIQHGKRVACMALETARSLDLDQGSRRDLYHAALIHDIGVSSTEAHRHLVDELEWESTQAHCDAGARLLAEFRPLAHLAKVLRHHHTHWDRLGTTALSPRERQLANLIFLCDRVDALRAQHLRAGDTDPAGSVRALIRQRAGTFFAPPLVEAFLAAGSSLSFWERLAPRALERYFATEQPPDPDGVLALRDIRDLGRLFAHVVDAKSPYTARHSEGVAQVSCHLARRLGFASEQIQLLDTAALLHDLGKLRVPDAILDKPAPLDPTERIVMRRHAHDSYSILERIEGLQTVAQWAGLHHETPCGDGYPEDLREQTLPLQARIISAADVFQALAQDRPYRPGMSPDAILAVMTREVRLRHLDPTVVALIAEELDTCWRAATGRYDSCQRAVSSVSP